MLSLELCLICKDKNGEDDKLITSIDDSIDTMAVVDSCGISSESGGLTVDYAE